MSNAALITLIITIAVAAIQAVPIPPAGASAVIPMNQEEMAANVKKFSEVYKLATQLMNLGGKFLNNAEGSAAASSTAVRGGGGGGGGGGGAFGDFGTDNGVLGDSIRPQFRGVPNYDSNSGGSLFERATRAFTGGSNYGPSAPSNNFGAVAAPPSLSEYGGGPLGSGTGKVQSARTTALDSILNTFLGSSLGGASGGSSGPSMTDFFNPNYKDYGRKTSQYGNNGGEGSNIEELIAALSRNGAKPARPEPESRNLFSQFLG
uniref:Uncharacterized protein n=1 Tax=Panagrolaimus superbus TaxID=310955 RepID=A0A914Z4F8_9BILA